MRDDQSRNILAPHLPLVSRVRRELFYLRLQTHQIVGHRFSEIVRGIVLQFDAKLAGHCMRQSHSGRASAFFIISEANLHHKRLFHKQLCEFHALVQ